MVRRSRVPVRPRTGARRRERIEIPYEDMSLGGVFFRAPDAAPGERRPLVVMNNGSDGPTSSMWLEGGAAAAERGYHWMAFDGPGQQAALYEQNLPFRHDWEAVLTGTRSTAACRVTGPKQLVRFTARAGAAGRCEPMARSLRETRIFDWLEDYRR